MIKASAVLETIKQLGKHNPNVSRNCRYVHDDATPCCIVGTALIENGMDPQPFLADEDLNRWTTVEELFVTHGDELGLVIDIPDDRFAALKLVQLMQDKGDRWGVAITALG